MTIAAIESLSRYVSPINPGKESVTFATQQIIGFKGFRHKGKVLRDFYVCRLLFTCWVNAGYEKEPRIVCSIF
jgi:hypothetical protein